MGEWLDEIVDISEEGDTDMRIDSIGALAKDARIDSAITCRTNHFSALRI
jgi:hypothetical protein